ncbi:MAG: hypothetical protein KQJ78_14205 [Deltaproteobacteria bacterium]|nr:hypothetical protein [Deltaproteobacteria bacterium]
MDRLQRENLDRLLQPRSGPLISLFLPMHREPTGAQEDRIRLKNLLAQVEEDLQSAGLSRPEAQDILRSLRQQDESGDLWRPRGDGLAVFGWPGGAETFRLPLDFQELAVVGERFHLKPLLPLVSPDGLFHLLALSQKHTRLYLLSRLSIKELEVPDLPVSMAEVLRFDDPEKQLQMHSGTEPRPGGRAAMFHGQGVGIDDNLEHLERFSLALQRPLAKYLAEKRIPLMLAGGQPLLSVFRKRAAGLEPSEEVLDINPDSLSQKELHEKAWQGFSHFHELRLAEETGRYQEKEAQGLASHGLREILAAAANHRVDTLYVALDRQVWGRRDSATGQVQVADAQEPGLEDLLNQAALETLGGGGVVFALETSQVPGGSLAAAIMRY